MRSPLDLRKAPAATLLLCASLLAGAVGALDGCSSTPGDQLQGDRTDAALPAPAPAPAPSSGSSTPDAAVEAEASAPDEVIPTWNDDQALAWLQKECAGCHGIDGKTGQKAVYYSAWPLEAKGITRAFLETNELTPIAYETILHRVIDAVGASPSMMPPDAPDPVKRLEMKSVLDWFTRSVPFAVIDANARYGNDASKQQKVIANFTCAKSSTLRTYLSRVTLGALDRPPTPAEFAAFTSVELASPVTVAQRQAIVAKLTSTWQAEFMTSGLRKLATVIGGGPGIKPAGAITATVASDLKDELYQLFVAKYATNTYDDYFTSNVVMVSPNTAAFYGCAVAPGWTPCALTAPRGGFFTTLGFLNSKPVSFLKENNNYGRASALFFSLYGESLLAATDGPTGDGIPALPACLESTDTRTYQGAPRGAAAVPAFGKLCQSCHLSRNMAAGAVLFRPFASTGELFSAATLGAPGAPDKAFYDDAVTPVWEYKTAASDKFQVNGAFLTTLLLAPVKACVATGNPAAPYLNVSSVSDLAAHLLANRTSFARGFMRHAQRAFANVETITLEMAYRSLTAFDAGQNKLPDLVSAYFLSDTLACEATP